MASKEKKHGSWHVRYRDLDGVQRTVVAGKTEKEANDLKAQVEEWLANDIDPKRAKATVKQTMEVFFGEHVIPNLGWKTMRDYQSAFERYHLEPWSRTPIRTINRYDIKRHRDGIARTGISNKRVNNVMVPFNRLFSWAEAEGYIQSNPASGLKPLPVAHEEMLYFTPERLDMLVQACDAHNGFYRAHILTLAWTGLRLGELRELRFKDIKWELRRPRIHVQRAMKSGTNDVGPPKSGKPRWVGVPPHIAEILREQKDLLGASDDDLVFPSHNGGRFDPDNLRNRVFNPALEQLGWREATEKKRRPKNGHGARVGRGYCPPRHKGTEADPRPKNYRLHDLRHTYAYIFLNIGRGDLFALKETMGHAQIATTMRYTHFSEDDAVHAADTLEAAWNKVVSGDRDGPSSPSSALSSDQSVGQKVGQPTNKRKQAGGFDASDLLVSGRGGRI